MIPELRQNFNRRFSAAKYQTLLRTLEQRCGTPVQFRVCETPCFFPARLLEKMARFGKELMFQLQTPEYRKASERAIPPEFNVPGEDSHPLFIQVDFGLVRDESGELQPRLVELQGFPSLYAYQPLLAETYAEIFELNSKLRFLMSGLNRETYNQLAKRAVLGNHDPENVILMEIDPLHQKTLPDFLATEKLFGIKTIAITDIKKNGKRLFYGNLGRQVPIARIYNRAIVDELVRKKLELGFKFTDDLEVEWAGHPNWYFRMSKFSLPYLKHESVPQTWFLDDPRSRQRDLSKFILKPLFSFAGLGVNIHPTKEDLQRVPPHERGDYVLQERMDFEPVIETPAGQTKAEIRIMFIWVDEPAPVMTIIRTGRGLMMGVDHNKNMDWVGSSAGFYPPTELIPG
jgi:hypothetical protein